MDWQTTTIGKQFSHAFGYGSIDAWGLVEMAKTWDLVKPQDWFFSPLQKLDKAIPQGKTGLSAQFEVTKNDLKQANLERVEHVTVTMNVQHTRRGDLSVELISPGNVTSYLASRRFKDASDAGYDNWTFMSVAHWYVSVTLKTQREYLRYYRGESGIGKWTLIIKDTQVNQYSGKLIDWDLKLWGEAIEEKKAKTPPLPDDGRGQDIAADEVAADSDDDSAAPSSARADVQIVSLVAVTVFMQLARIV